LAFTADGKRRGGAPWLAQGSSLTIQSTTAKRFVTDERWPVTPGTILNFLPLFLGMFALQPSALQQGVTRLVVQNEVILRVPVQPRPLVQQVEWIEHKGPRCIPATAIRRALLSGAEQVDFILANRIRVRAQFDEDCPALDFYGGFYLQPQDARLCAGRDAVHSRIGGSCTIERFKQLVPRLREAQR
jgi:hypothetical protein